MAQWWTGDPTINQAIEAAIAEQSSSDSGAYVPKVKAFDAQTGTAYLAVAADAGKIVTLNNASAIALTLPQDSAAAIPVGSEITFIQLGAGLVTCTAGAGATVHVHGTGAGKFLGQYSVVRAIKTAVNTWTLTGDVALS